MSFTELLMSIEIGLIYGIVAIGIYLTFRIIDFPDLTCDGSFVLGAVTSAVLIKNGHSPIISLLIASIAGGVAGFITGILHTKLRITNLLSGILVAFMLYSVNLRVMGGIPNIALINQTTIFNYIIINPLLLLIITTGIIWLLFGYLLITDFGLALYSIGQNKRLAINVGIKTQQMIIIGLILSNTLIAFGGALFSQHQDFADVSQGVGTVIIGLAAVMIGESILRFRSPWIIIASCILGSVVYRIFVAIALHSDKLGLETQDLNIITGLLVIGVMLIPRRGSRAC